MTKLWKKLSIIGLLLCLALFAGALAACDPKEEEPETLIYSVTVINDAEAPVSGVKVKFGNFTQTTDADGKASMELEKGDYTISLSALPEGYTYSQDIKLTAESREVIATLVKGEGTPPPVKPVDPNAPREYRVTVLYPDGNPVTGINVQFCIGTLCLTPIDVNAQGQASMTRTPDNYHIKINKVPAGYTYPQDADGYYTGGELSADKQTMTITLVSTTPTPKPEEPENTVTEVKTAGEYDVTVNGKNVYAAVNFAPALPGEYQITSLTDELDPMVGYYAYRFSTADYASLDNEKKNDDTSATDKNFRYSVKITSGEIMTSDGQFSNAIWQFRVFVKDKKLDGTDVTFPATVKIKIEKIGEAIERAKQTKDAPLTATLSQFEEANGRTAKSVEMKSTTVLAFNETDGFYHLGTADGPVVMVLLTEPCRFLDRALTEMDEFTGNMGGDYGVYIFDETPAADKNDESKPLIYTDYRLMLRGRKAYITNSETPEATEDEYYTKYVNADGMYGLTKDLEKFLKNYIDRDGGAFIKMQPAASGAEQDCLWMFACYYYEEEESEPQTQQIDLIDKKYEA